MRTTTAADLALALFAVFSVVGSADAVGCSTDAPDPPAFAASAAGSVRWSGLPGRALSSP